MTSAANTGALARLLEQATPGPWEAYNADLYWHVDMQPEGPHVCNTGRDSWPQSQDNARLIALAPDAVRLLTDMAAWAEYATDRLDHRYASQESFTEGTALLARFAELEARAADAH